MIPYHLMNIGDHYVNTITFRKLFFLSLFWLCGPALAEPIVLDLSDMDAVTAGGPGRGHAVAPFLVLPHAESHREHPHPGPTRHGEDRHANGQPPTPVSTVNSGSVVATASATGPGSSVRIISIERVTAQGVFIFTSISASGGQSANASLQQLASVTTTNFHH
jgi:hypothetical protein